MGENGHDDTAGDTTELKPADDAKPFFKVIFVDPTSGQVQIETNIRDPRGCLAQLVPVIEHLRRQAMVVELSQMQQQQLKAVQLPYAAQLNKRLFRP